MPQLPFFFREQVKAGEPEDSPAAEEPRARDPRDERRDRSKAAHPPAPVTPPQPAPVTAHPPAPVTPHPPAPVTPPRSEARAAANATPRPSLERERERPARAPQPEAPVVLTVSELQRRLRNDIEERYRIVFVSGEISNYQINARSGHGYFTLKDDGAQIKCVIWRDQLIRLRHRLDDGLEVIVKGRITIYEQGGQLQLSVQTVEPKGLGARQLEFRERAEKLRAEGLTSAARKRPLPAFPRCIGVVTSSSGAALRDVLRTIIRRDPFACVVIANTTVQGDGAAHNIVRALKALERLGRCEVILLVRGGGSIEDLWCFNEEAVARAIVASPVPVVTGIGHETDTTIADLVADLRASTPTAAAEHAVPVRSEIRQRFLNLEGALHRSLLARLQLLSRRLYVLSARLKDPVAALKGRAQHLDELTNRAERALRLHAGRRQADLTRLERRLGHGDPKQKIRGALHTIQILSSRQKNAIARSIQARRHRLRVAVERLESLSPLRVLSRGYALVRAPSGAVLKRSDQTSIGDALEIRLADGVLGAVVTRIDLPEPNKN